MRRQSFDLLFEPKYGLNELLNTGGWGKSIFWFLVSMGSFWGVMSNVFLAEETLAVRFGILLGILLAQTVWLFCFACYLHGVTEACGAPTGDIRTFLRLLGFTGFPFLVMTPVALAGAKTGGAGIVLIALACCVGFFWWAFLTVKALTVAYLISAARAWTVFLYGLFLSAVSTLLPLYLLVRIIALKIG